MFNVQITVALSARGTGAQAGSGGVLVHFHVLLHIMHTSYAYYLS